MREQRKARGKTLWDKENDFEKAESSRKFSLL